MSTEFGKRFIPKKNSKDRPKFFSELLKMFREDPWYSSTSVRNPSYEVYGTLDGIKKQLSGTGTNQDKNGVYSVLFLFRDQAYFVGDTSFLDPEDRKTIPVYQLSICAVPLTNKERIEFLKDPEGFGV